MKDMIGREIQVGDTVAYVSNPGYGPRLTIGRVEMLVGEGSGIRVERMYAGHDVKEGMRQRWDYDPATKKYSSTPCKARATTVCMSDRIYVIG